MDEQGFLSWINITVERLQKTIEPFLNQKIKMTISFQAADHKLCLSITISVTNIR